MAGISLFFPTGTDPRSPYLALPCLAAALRRASINVNLHDLDIGGLRAVLTPSNLSKASAVVRRFPPATIEQRPELQYLIRIADELVERAPNFFDVFSDAQRFYDPNEFNSARENLYSGVDLISLATNGKVRYSISPVRYDVNGVNIQKLSDLLEATKTDEFNLFADYWAESVYPRLEVEQPEIAGITITNAQQMIPGLTLARRLKERGYFVVIGGALFAKFVQRLYSVPEFFRIFADGVVPYEGETALIELLDALRGKRNFSKVPNFFFLDNDNVRSGPVHLEQVDSLPSPDFDGLPLNDYLTPEPVLPIYFGKGCYFNRCKFCDIPYINHISKKAYRVRSTETLIADLLSLNQKYGCRHFEFTDEALPPLMLDHLADGLEPYQSKAFRFVGYARLEPSLTAARCAKLARMGFRKFFFGLESGTQKMLDHMDKGIRLSDVPVVLRNCAAAGIRFHLFTIVGLPEETRSDAQETFEFFRKHAPIIDHPGNSFDIHPFGLELRTAYFNEASQNGVTIEPEALRAEFGIGVGPNWQNTRGLSPEETELLLNEFFLELRKIYPSYHAAPQHLWPAFEEFALLYADRYADRAFPFRTSLPKTRHPGSYRLRWNPAAKIFPYNEYLTMVMVRNDEVMIDDKTSELITSRRFRTVKEMLDDFSPAVPNMSEQAARKFVRSTIDALIQGGLLQLEPQEQSLT